MNEKGFWDSLRRAELFDAAYRIESTVTPGFPDVVYSSRGFTGLLELKSVAQSVKCPLKRAFEPSQFGWHAGAAGNIFVHCLLFLQNRAILLPTNSLTTIVQLEVEPLLERALWVGPERRIGRFEGLMDKLEKLNETFRMARAGRAVR